MTVICDKCGKSYFVNRAVGVEGQLLRLLCPHCGNLLWSTLPHPPARSGESKVSGRLASRFPRGIS